MEVKVVVEYNADGFLVYADNFPGAFSRGRTKKTALGKMPAEIVSYNRWQHGQNSSADFSIIQVQEAKTELNVADADSEVIFDSEKLPLARERYFLLKQLVLKSAYDFRGMYRSIPDKDFTNLPKRKTFYGDVPRTAKAMLAHTNNVTSYYAAQLGARLNNLEDIYQNRIEAIKAIEKVPHYMDNKVIQGDYNELWSLRKVLRRFIWHDRIHAKAMYRLARSKWDADTIANPFFFTVRPHQREEC